MQELKEYFTTKLNHLQNLLNETRLEVNNLDTVKENITSIPFKYDVEKLLKDENYRAEIILFGKLFREFKRGYSQTESL